MGDDWHISDRHRHWGVRPAVVEFTRLTDFEVVAAGPAAQFCIRRGARYGRRSSDGAPIADRRKAAMRVLGRRLLRRGQA